MSNTKTKQDYLADLEKQYAEDHRINRQGWSRIQTAAGVLGLGSRILTAPHYLATLLVGLSKVFRNEETDEYEDMVILRADRQSDVIGIFISIDENGCATPSITMNGTCSYFYKNIRIDVRYDGVIDLFDALIEFCDLKNFGSKTIEKYILSVIDENGGVHPVRKGECSEFEAYDSVERYFSLSAYRLFDSIDDVRDAISNGPNFNKRNVYDSGYSTPPSVLWSALGINNERMSSEGKYRISKVTVETVEEFSTGLHAIGKSPHEQ